MRILVPIVLLIAPGAARANDTCELPPDVVSAEACEGFFGDAEVRHDNRALREARLIDVTEGEYAIDLSYRGDWETPRSVSYDDVELVGTLACDSGTIAVIDLRPRVDIGCPPGRYAVRADASLGEDASVLAVLSEIMLIVHHGELQYLKAPEADEPVFRLAWRAPFTIAKPRSSGPVRSNQRARNTRHGRRR